MNRKFLIAIPVVIGIIGTITIVSFNFQNGIGNGENSKLMSVMMTCGIKHDILSQVA